MKLSHRIIPAVLLSMPAAAHAGGMPQLDFSTPLTVSQVVWGVLIFVPLYFLLKNVGLPKVDSVLQERASLIAKDLEEARAAKESADSDMAAAAQATAKARAEAQASIASAVEEAKAAAAARAEVLNAKLDKQLQDAEAQIGSARSAAMSALRQVATETAGDVVSRLTGAVPDAGRLDSAIGSALAARGIA
jgi:F-type H+-transporting ATPase subunit b